MKCEYLFLKGKKKGMMCGNDTKNETTLCCIHTERKHKHKILYNKIPKGRRPDPLTDFKVVWDNTHSLYLHRLTNLIVKNQNSRDVIGVLRNNCVCNLEEDDRFACIEWKLNYLEPRISQELD